MGTRQMEEIQQKLAALNYPRANVPAQSLLFAGMERYALLEWLFFRLLGEKSPFTQQNLQGDGMDRDEEAARIQYLAEIAKFLGITSTVDMEAIQGRGSYENRSEMLRLIVDLVEASCYSDNPEWRLQKTYNYWMPLQRSKLKFFLKNASCFLLIPDITELEDKLSEHTKQLSSLQQVVNELASKQNYNPDEDHTEAEAQLRMQLEAFLETARAFNVIYTKEIRPWTHMMELPQLHGLGPAANHLLENYKVLLKFLRNLRNLRESHAAVAVGSEATVDNNSVPSKLEFSSVTKIISECEEALNSLNHDLGILSASRAREQGGEHSAVD